MRSRSMRSTARTRCSDRGAIGSSKLPSACRNQTFTKGDAMLSVTVHKVRDDGDSPPSFKRLDRLFAGILQRVLARSEERALNTGSEIADWLAAKREVLWAPPLELTETDTDFRIRMAAPGFDASEIEVAA